MTAPRQILPGTCYLVTRRCAHRQLLLRPSALTTQLVGYLLAVAARRHGILLHAYCVMSNHVHLVLTDPSARLPAFSQYFDSLVARSVNALLGRWEAFWAPSSYSAVALVGRGDVLDKVAYVLGNPVAAGLVRRGREWPGLWSDPSSVGGEAVEFERPDRFFRKRGPMPDRASLIVVPPPHFASAEQFRNEVAGCLAALERAAAVAQTARGVGVLGSARVLRQRPTARPKGSDPRRGLKPRVGCRDKWKRIELLGRLTTFLHAYRRALGAWRAGVSGVVFPAGTYLVRLTHGVACASSA